LQTTDSVSGFSVAISGYDDLDFDGHSDSLGDAHAQTGPYLLYLSVMDGVNDPDFSGGLGSGIDPEDAYDPATQADLAVYGFLGDTSSGVPFYPLKDDVDVISFDASDASYSLPETAFIVDPATFDPETFNPYAGPDPSEVTEVLNGFFAAVGAGKPIAAVLDNNPFGFGQFLGSASYVEDMDLGVGPAGEDLNFGAGILLTSGVGTPPDTNTSSSFSGNASGTGDDGLDTILQAAFAEGLFNGDGFDSAPKSTDATALAFEFTVPEDSNAVVFDFMFGTEEFPDWNSPDVAAIVIDGRNYAIFPDGTPTIFDPDAPIAGLLVDNSSGAVAIEYDGISPVRHMVAPLDADLDVHTFKAVVSDVDRLRTGDTGLFLGGMSATVVDGGVDPSDPILPPPDDDPTDGYDFRIELGDAGIGLDPSTPIWIDPEVAVGYEYSVTGSTFATATLPAGFGDDLYQVSWWDPAASSGSGAYVLLDSGHDGGLFSALELIDFTSLVSLDGVIGFQVLDIEILAGLDPDDSNAFPTGVTFTSGGVVNVKMTPIIRNVGSVPEPGTLLLLGGGLLGFGGLRRWKI